MVKCYPGPTVGMYGIVVWISCVVKCYPGPTVGMYGIVVWITSPSPSALTHTYTYTLLMPAVTCDHGQVSTSGATFG